LRALGTADLPGALELSGSAHWNQNEADWRALLTLGEAWGIDAAGADGRERLAASTVILPYGRSFAWVSMVLVLPEFRRRGYATRLLRHARGSLAARGMAAVLDATPAGHAVYAQEGFVDTWGFARYRRDRGPATRERAAGPSTRALRDSDWPAIEALDTPAFGANRLALLRLLAQRWPQAARVVEEGDRLRGFVFGRDGREAHQIGPLLAGDPTTATSLIDAALRAAPGPVYLDLLDSCKALLPWLQQQGLEFQRPFTRMVHGAARAPGDPSPIVLAAGPELG
jgi:GNAT superfamily N-acetyltransferase